VFDANIELRFFVVASLNTSTTLGCRSMAHLHIITRNSGGNFVKRENVVRGSHAGSIADAECSTNSQISDVLKHGLGKYLPMAAIALLLDKSSRIFFAKWRSI
jgi:hypothetical protein